MTAARKQNLPQLTRDDALTALIALAVSLGALAMASITPGFFLPAALASAASAVLASRVAVRKERPVYPALVLLVLGAFSAFQALPMPLGVVARFSPAAADVWARCLLPFGGGVRFASLSLDPAGSLFEAEKFVAYGSIFFAASRLAAVRGATRGILVVVGTGVAVATVTLVHSLLRIEHVYGLYAPRYSFGTERIGPFLNTNNLAGFMNLALFAGLGLVASRRVALSLRWSVGLGLLAIMAVAFSTASRGGLGALVIGAAALAITLALMQRRSPRAERDPSSIRATLALLTLAFAACAIWFGTDDTFRVELVTGNAQKLKLALATRPMIAEFPWFGVGRGAFESSFDAYRPALAGSVLYTHPENFVAQWVTEWGVLVAPFALGALAYLLRPTRLGFGRSNLATASYVGAVVLVLQNFADLGLELAGTSLALFALLGTLHGAHADKSTQRTRAPAWHRAVVLVGSAMLVLLAVRPLFGAGELVSQARERVRGVYFAAAGDPEARARLGPALVEAMSEHPAEPYFPMVGAMNALRSGEGPVIPFVQRALERGPHVGRTHLVLGEALARAGARKQALFEVGLAVTYDGLLVANAARLAAMLTTDADELFRITPDNENGPLFPRGRRRTGQRARRSCNARCARQGGAAPRSLALRPAPPPHAHSARCDAKKRNRHARSRKLAGPRSRRTPPSLVGAFPSIPPAPSVALASR